VVPAQRLRRYEVLAKLAAGGMGEIFLARLEGAAGFEKLCVIKRILPHLADDSRFRQMMIAEARLAAKLSHANIGQIYELDEIDGQLYIAMEFLEGVTALALLRKAAKLKRPLDLGLIAGVLAQVCDGLHYAHELRDRETGPLGIVHRDVTPSNIFVTETGVAKLLDFGIAKVENVANTESGAIKGKYAYMAPEQLRGLEVDRRADIFAAGIVLFELLALRRLFQRKTDYLTFQAVLEQPLRDVRKYRPDAPDALVAVMERALSSQPAQRFDNARQLRAALIAAIGVPLWGAHEIADYVGANFTEDITRRHANISAAAKRDGKGTLPTIWSGSSADPDEDDEYFVGASHTGMPSLSALAAEGVAFDDVPARPNVTAPTKVDAPRRMPQHKRSRQPLLAAAIALGVAAIGVTAYLTLRSSQQASREPAQPTANDPYSLALVPYRAVLDKCRHERGTLPDGARANVLVSPNGRAYEVGLEPKALADSALGGCVRDALLAVKFPAATSREQVVIALSVR